MKETHLNEINSNRIISKIMNIAAIIFGVLFAASSLFIIVWFIIQRQLSIHARPCSLMRIENPKDLFGDVIVEKNSDNKILIHGRRLFMYYHLCMMGHWKNVVRNMFRIIMKNKKFINYVTHINIVIVKWTPKGEEHLRAILKSLHVPDDKWTILQTYPESDEYERPTLQLMRKNSESQDAYLYLHSKGITHSGRKIRNVQNWVAIMMHFLVEHTSTAMSLLRDHDVVGSLFITKPKPHFSGNFWMSTGAHLKLQTEIIGKNYLDPEMYITSSSEGQYASMFNLNYEAWNLYHIPIKREEYEDKFQIRSTNPDLCYLN